jgi:flagellar basal body rod protein FlgG
MGHISYFATRSLKAIDDWMTTCQTNLSGSGRVSFKQSELFYGPGPVTIVNTPTMLTAGKQYAEQALNTGYTRVNWKEGDMVSSTQDTHFGIQGDGFFLVTVPPQMSYNGFNPTPAAQAAQNVNSLITRDGELHFSIVPAISATDPVLCTKEGFIVMGDVSGGSGTSTAGVGNSDNVYIPILQSKFYDPVERQRPSVVFPTNDPVNENAIGSKVPLDMLQFSKYGSTIYNIDANQTVKTLVNGSGNILDRRNVADTAGDSVLKEKVLESSNVDVSMNITEMAALGKIYNGFVQLIKVYNGTLDEVLGFIR